MRQARLMRGLSLRALAELCAERGIATNDSNLSKYERGLVMPYPPLRALLADLLDLDIDLKAHQQVTS